MRLIGPTGLWLPDAADRPRWFNDWGVLVGMVALTDLVRRLEVWFVHDVLLLSLLDGKEAAAHDIQLAAHSYWYPAHVWAQMLVKHCALFLPHGVSDWASGDRGEAPVPPVRPGGL